MDHKMSVVNMGWDSLCPALPVIWQQKSTLSTQYKGGDKYEGVLIMVWPAQLLQLERRW